MGESLMPNSNSSEVSGVSNLSSGDNSPQDKTLQRLSMHKGVASEGTRNQKCKTCGHDEEIHGEPCIQCISKHETKEQKCVTCSCEKFIEEDVCDCEDKNPKGRCARCEYKEQKGCGEEFALNIEYMKGSNRTAGRAYLMTCKEGNLCPACREESG